MSPLIVIFNNIKYNLAITGAENSRQLFAKIFSGDIHLSLLKTLLLAANHMSPLKNTFVVVMLASHTTFATQCLALSSRSGHYHCKIATLSFRVLCMYCASDTWHHLMLSSCCLGAQRSRNYAIQVAMIMPTISY